MHEPLRSLRNVYKQYDCHKKYVFVKNQNCSDDIRLMSQVTHCND